LGCAAFLPGLRLASMLAAAEPQGGILLIAAEAPSAFIHAQTERPNKGDLIAAGLFGDGAAAAIVSSCGAKPVPHGAIDIVDVVQETVPSGDISMNRGKVVLSRDLIGRVAGPAISLLTRLLRDNGIGVGEVDHWALHTGSSRIIRAIGESLGLPPEAIRPSEAVLREHGNLSSASLPTIMQRLCRGREGKPLMPGQIGIMLGFGAGLYISACLWRVVAP
jgi:alkylresorcinol/alkylpyrone synthase